MMIRNAVNGRKWMMWLTEWMNEATQWKKITNDENEWWEETRWKEEN